MSTKITLETLKKSVSLNDTVFSRDGRSDAKRSVIFSATTADGMHVGSLFKIWAEVSKINYLSAHPLQVIASGHSIRRRSIGLPAKEYSIKNFVSTELRNKSEEDLFVEQFPINVTSLMNEDQLWGCFYTFPELYADVYSPIVRIRRIEDVPELVGGVLTRDMVTACLTYLKRTPILGDFVYIKLDLSSKHLNSIDVLQHYKYLVYLDLSSNLLTVISVLSYLPYLQFLSVAFNRLGTVLEYDTPQWFLTEVHYKYNSVKRIRNLSAFWSITILDLSHNNIKSISGLESLRYLRRLDLSFNHIQRLENLNNLRLLWLDVSYNNISNFEFGPLVGLWTLFHLEFLNLNENNLTSMKMFSGCIRLREVHARNNRLGLLLELAVYMRQMRRLIVLDLRANPICSTPGYKDVVVNTFPILLNLDAEELDPVEQRTLKMNMSPDVTAFSTRRLLRLLYIEQLSRAEVSPYIPPADTTEVPIVVLVGDEAVGKGTLARRLAAECSSHIKLGIQHTTAPYHSLGHYIEVTRDKFDDYLLAGEFLTYSEMDGESYGLSREEAFISDGKVTVVSMDLLGALMLKLRGRRPYFILTYSSDKRELAKRQHERKVFRNMANKHRMSLEAPLERSTLQVLLSGRIIITGILNEIILCLPDEKENSEFVIESECSLMMDSDARQAVRDFARGVNLLALLTSSTTSLEEAFKGVQDKGSQNDTSLYSLYKESQGTGDEYVSFVNGQNSYQSKRTNEVRPSKMKQEKHSSISQRKSVDFSRYASSSWKDSAKSSKSVTFTSQDNAETENVVHKTDPSDDKAYKAQRSISTRLPCSTRGQRICGSRGSQDDLDLWFAFLTETGVAQTSDIVCSSSEIATRRDTKIDDPDFLIRQMDLYRKMPFECVTTTIRDEYEGIHLKYPGLFWNSVDTNDPNKAFIKMKRIIRDIVNSQKSLTPMFDIDFANLKHYPTVEKRLANIRQQIAPQRLFY